MAWRLLGIVLAWSVELAAQVSSGPRPLERTYWKAIELGGTPVPAQESFRDIYLVLQDRGRVYSSDGCNRVSGTYELKNTSIRFHAVAATRMACIDASGIDAVFLDALKGARQLTVTSERLELLDSRNRRVAAFLAVTQ
jgi:heat shock protein HslJ